VKRCDLSHTVGVGSGRYRAEWCAERPNSCMGEMGGTNIYRWWEVSSKCHKNGSHGGRGVGEGPLMLGGGIIYTQV
jgi:hypothetical protein